MIMLAIFASLIPARAEGLRREDPSSLDSEGDQLNSSTAIAA
jgi:hypothetical protein